MERLTYKPIPDYDRATAIGEIESGIPERIVRALLSLAIHNPDWRWVQNLCVGFSDSQNDSVRAIAILCFGHIARFQGALDTEVTIPILIDGLNDPSNWVRGNASDTLDDILINCSPREYDRAAAVDLLRSEQIDKTLLGLFAIAKSDSDSEFAQERCIEYSSHPTEVIRGQALKGFATIVYEHRQIDVEKVMRVLSEAASNEGYVGECARTTIEYIETYLQPDDGV